ncbi:hypothetical protein CB1_001814001 [Camelus ferus]|nr:hypothetical protein CB1_001814001 [Camelus ferus]
MCLCFKKAKNENSPDTQRSKSHAPWEENGPQSGLYNSPNDRTKSPKFPYTRRRNPSCGSDNDSLQPTRRRSRSRCNTSSGSESENSNREHRKKRNRKELVDPSGLSEEQLKEIPYTKIETQGDPIRIRHSHSPRSYRQYRRSQCSDGERSVLSEVNSYTKDIKYKGRFRIRVGNENRIQNLKWLVLKFRGNWSFSHEHENSPAKLVILDCRQVLHPETVVKSKP